MAVRIQTRRDTAANWTSANPTLASGEFGVESDTLRFKIGSGTTPWNSLPYAGEAGGGGSGDGSFEISTGNVTGPLALDLDNHKNVNVYGTIRGDVTLSFTNVPSGAVTVTYVVAQNNVGNHSITYPAGVTFLNGGDGSINPSPNSVSVVSMVTTNGGANWVAAVSDSRPNQYDAFYANPQEDGPIYWVIDSTMTLDLGNIRTAGTGSVVAARRVSGGSTFVNVNTATVFNAGDVLRLTISGLGSWYTLTVPRLA